MVICSVLVIAKQRAVEVRRRFFGAFADRVANVWANLSALHGVRNWHFLNPETSRTAAMHLSGETMLLSANLDIIRLRGVLL